MFVSNFMYNDLFKNFNLMREVVHEIPVIINDKLFY